METLKKRNTPEIINHLEANEIFVFGSNKAGLHYGGAARVAANLFGAVIGEGIGLQGNSYAIPTLDENFNQLHIQEVEGYVSSFVEYAKASTDKCFLVTKIGCGIAGFSVEDIAPLFKECIGTDNVVLPIEFENFILLEKTQS